MMKLIKFLLLIVGLLAVGYFSFKDKVDPYLPPEVKAFSDKIQEKMAALIPSTKEANTEMNASGSGNALQGMSLKKTLGTIDDVKANEDKKAKALDEIGN